MSLMMWTNRCADSNLCRGLHASLSVLLCTPISSTDDGPLTQSMSVLSLEVQMCSVCWKQSLCRLWGLIINFDKDTISYSNGIWLELATSTGPWFISLMLTLWACCCWPSESLCLTENSAPKDGLTVTIREWLFDNYQGRLPLCR